MCDAMLAAVTTHCSAPIADCWATTVATTKELSVAVCRDSEMNWGCCCCCRPYWPPPCCCCYTSCCFRAGQLHTYDAHTLCVGDALHLQPRLEDIQWAHKRSSQGT